MMLGQAIQQYNSAAASRQGSRGAGCPAKQLSSKQTRSKRHRLSSCAAQQQTDMELEAQAVQLCNLAIDSCILLLLMCQ